MPHIHPWWVPAEEGGHAGVLLLSANEKKLKSNSTGYHIWLTELKKTFFWSNDKILQWHWNRRAPRWRANILPRISSSGCWCNVLSQQQQQQQQYNAPGHKAWNHLKLLPWTWQRVHRNSKGLRSHQLSEIGVVDKSAATVATLFTSCHARTPRPRFLQECFSTTLLNLWHERRPKAALKAKKSKVTDIK